MYDKSIRASLRKDMITEEDRWLRDENGCSYVPTGSALTSKGIEEARKELFGEGIDAVTRMEEDAENVVDVNDSKRKRIMDSGSNLFTESGRVIFDKQESFLERARSEQ